MNKLPNEILAEVCLQCLDNTLSFDGSYSHYTPFNLDLPPWNLSYVCSRWRIIIISLPALWSHISLPQSTGPTGSRQKYSLGVIQLIKLCLERSKDTWLRIQFDMPFEKNQCHLDAINTLFQHTYRFDALDITSFEVEHGPDITSISHPFTWNLRALRFESNSFAPAWLVDIVKTTSMLHTLETARFPPSSFTFAEIGSFGSILTKLYIGTSSCPCNTTFILIVLSSLPVIQNACFWLDDDGDEDIAMEAPAVVTSQSLSSLILGSDVLIAPSFTSKLVLPSLKSMTMYTSDKLCHISSLIERSGCSLNTLHVCPDNDDSAQLHNLLAAAPKLEALAISTSPLPGPLLVDLFAIQVNKVTLCPLLEKMYLILGHYSSQSMGETELLVRELATVIRSRTNGPAEGRLLRAVKLTIREDDNDDNDEISLSLSRMDTDQEFWSRLCEITSEESMVELWRACYRSNEDVVRLSIEMHIPFDDDVVNVWTAQLDSATSPAERTPCFVC